IVGFARSWIRPPRGGAASAISGGSGLSPDLMRNREIGEGHLRVALLFLAFGDPPPNLPHKGGGAARWSRHHPATSPMPHPPPCGEGWGGGGRGNGILLSTPAAI